MTTGRPSGISLLEVLISIFVLMIGLLAVAAVIPVGRYAIREAAKSGHAATCGQAVLNDIKVRKMINPNNWARADGVAISQQRPWCWGDTTPGPPATQQVVRRSGFPLGESYAIDSFNVAGKIPNDRGHLTHFPYNIRELGFPILPGRAWGWTRMRRVTWNGVGLDKPLATEVFGWHDDLVIPVPADETQRPRQMFFNGSAEGRAFPRMPGEAAVRNPLQGQDSGNYSWMVTVTPSAEKHDFVFPNITGSAPADRLPYHYSENAPLFNVSVVVFYKRATPPPSDYLPTRPLADETPSERQVELKFLGGGFGGGDVRLFTLRTPVDDLTVVTHPDRRDRRDYLDIKENEWLMVSGFHMHYYDFYLQDGTQVTPDPTDPNFDSSWLPVGVHKWYRIVASGETASEDSNGNKVLDPGEDLNNNGVIDWYREVTLDGPDWNSEWAVQLYPSPALKDRAFATLLSGVIGVYSETIELEW